MEVEQGEGLNPSVGPPCSELRVSLYRVIEKKAVLALWLGSGLGHMA